MTTMAIAFIILGAGIGSLRESIDKILHPEYPHLIFQAFIIAVAIVKGCDGGDSISLKVEI